jgi:hypothetical protein
MMELKPGSRWRSSVCNTEVTVVRPPKMPVTLECGGAAMLPLQAGTAGPAATAAPAGTSGTLIGKRYADDASGLEVLCTRAGSGAVSADGRAMPAKQAKALPSSD